MSENKGQLGLGRAWRELRSLFFDEEPARNRAQVASTRPEPPRAARTARGGKAQPSASGADPALAAYCAKTAGMDSVVAGRVHLLNLEAVKARLGSRWTRTRGRVHRLIENELRTRLTARDFFSRSRGDSYVIVFGDCDEAEAKLKVSLLTEAVLAKLFGSEDAEALRAVSVQSVVAKADGQLATQALGSTDALFDFLEEAQQQQTAAASEDAAAPLGMTEEQIDTILKEVEHQLQLSAGRGRGQPRLSAERLHEVLARLREMENELARRLDELIGDKGNERPDIALDPGMLRFAYESLKSLRRLRKLAEDQLPADEDLETVPAQLADAPAAKQAGSEQVDLDVGYRPFWHRRSGKIGIYRAEVRLRLPGGGVAGDNIILGEDLQEAVDRLVLLQSRRDLERAMAEAPAIASIPVHYSTLVRIGSQRRYLDLCRNISPEHRRAIVWELLGVPRQAYQAQLQHHVELLRPFGRAVFLDVLITEHTFACLPRDLQSIGLAGVTAIGVNLQQIETSEDDLFRLIDYMAKLAEGARLKCYATGIETRSLMLAASSAGFEYISGPAVADRRPELEGVHSTALADLYLQQLDLSASAADGTTD